RVHDDGHGDAGERTRPTAAHRVGHGDAHGRGVGHAVFLQRIDEFFKILHRDATARAASGETGEVGGVESEFVHAGAEAGTEVDAGAHRHRETALNGGFHGGRFAVVDDVFFRDGEME